MCEALLYLNEWAVFLIPVLSGPYLEGRKRLALSKTHVSLR